MKKHTHGYLSMTKNIFIFWPLFFFDNNSKNKRNQTHTRNNPITRKNFCFSSLNIKLLIYPCISKSFCCCCHFRCNSFVSQLFNFLLLFKFVNFFIRFSVFSWNFFSGSFFYIETIKLWGMLFLRVLWMGETEEREEEFPRMIPVSFFFHYW